MKKLLKKYLPSSKEIKQNKYLKILGKLIYQKELWIFNKYTVSKAFSAGMFAAFIPLPLQMVIAGAIAIYLRANFPVAIALVWVSNPITTPPIAYFCYKIGAMLLDRKIYYFNFDVSLEWLMAGINTILFPFILGSIVVAFSMAIISNILIRIIWRISTILNYQRRKARRNNKTLNS